MSTNVSSLITTPPKPAASKDESKLGKWVGWLCVGLFIASVAYRMSPAGRESSSAQHEKVLTTGHKQILLTEDVWSPVVKIDPAKDFNARTIGGNITWAIIRDPNIPGSEQPAGRNTSIAGWTRYQIKINRQGVTNRNVPVYLEVYY